MNNYLEQLNKEQTKAVRHIDGPLMVIAGAGSGKTRVLTYRIIHLLKNKINPYNILALTFTNKAAKEMRRRIENFVGISFANNLWMGTFHSVFARILRFEADKINYPSNFTIYDTEDSKNLVKSIIKDLNLDKETYKVGIIRNRISALKNNFITSETYHKSNDLMQADIISKRTEFGKIYQTYENRCKKSSAMDFDDLLLKTYELLSIHADTLIKYQEKFKYILIDEYQDTNQIQYLIIKKLAALYENICVVGDDAQSIYSFRGANIQNILNFKLDYPDYKTYKLEQNYRSTATIVEAANGLIKKNEKQIRKEVWTHNKQGEKIIVAQTNSDNDEGRLVANTLFDIKMNNDELYKDFTILYRTNAQSRPLEEALRRKNIPYKIYGGLSFYQRKEVKDLLAYFRLTVNPNDDESFKRIVNYPARGIGATTIQKINIIANESNKSLWEVVNSIENYNINLNKGTLNKISNFSLMINDFIIQNNQKNAYDIGEEIANKSGLFHHLYNDKTPEGISRFENMQELLNGLKDFCENNENNNLTNFIQDIALLTDQDNEKDTDFNKVTLMTVHAAKGLEFPYVFVVGLEENLFPSMMSGESQEDMEEERRLFYVAITRAEKRLFLSYANTRFRWGQFIDCRESRFLNELDENLLDKKDFNIQKKYNIYTKTKKQNSTYKNTTQNIFKNRRLKKISSTNHQNHNQSNEKIVNGVIVKHAKFGKGKILNIEGDGANKKATVFFEGIGQKQLLLKFAKLDIIS